MGSSSKYRSLRGMVDLLPEDMERISWLEEKSRKTFQVFGYGEIRTPLLEETEVFTRSIGEDTDIVEKEMYSFTDRSDKNISLRPEGTASIIRAYIEHGWCNEQDILRLYYIGPMFRGERPQKGRQRQFHQIGAEVIGGTNPLIDVEAILSLDTLLRNLKVTDFTILINSLGCHNDRTKYQKALQKYLLKKEKDLCENCVRRMRTNVLRVLDCKSENCKKVIKTAPIIVSYLCKDCSEDYESVKQNLKDLNIKFKEKEDLVRGLDYYTGVVFEVVHQSLGSQDAIAAGGRYDKLCKQMGGPDVGATGYALGVERLLLAVNKKDIELTQKGVLVIPQNQELLLEAFKITSSLRKNGIPSTIDFSGRSFKGQMRKANRDGMEFVVIIGEDEIESKKLLLKDMREGNQEALEFDKMIEHQKQNLHNNN